MNRPRWLMTIALGLAPMLASMAIQGPVGSLKFGLSAAAKSSSNAGGKSDGKSSSSSSASKNSSSSSTGSNSSSTGSSSSSAVSVGVAPKAKVTNPHGPMSTPCANCHTYTSWKPIRANPEFNHDLTGYPLRGMHQNVGCTQCHTSMVFKNVGSQCSDCHADLHKRQFGANCSQCHTVRGWQVSLQAIKNHSNRFPLVGAHSVVQCEQCHKQAAVGQFVGMSTSCYSCHQQDFRTPVLDHVKFEFPTTCESCHSLNSWFNAKFDHLKYTGYALSGAHATLPCAACHINNVFNGTPAQCYSCHQADFINSNNPPHVKMGLPKDCAICHSTVDWANARFDHALYAKYPLTGKHAAVACAQCHTNNNYNNTPTDCYSCHKADFQGTNNPPHASGGFPTDCSLCHTTSGWMTSNFDHSKTKFPLTGAHITVQCGLCHVNNNYAGGLPTDCFGCHQTDYKNTNAPAHAASNIPTTCAVCHTTSSWSTSSFDHNKTKFPLTGAHAAVPCAQCHVNSNFTTLPTDCYGCHQKDFTGANKPNHVTGGFPTTCAVCHNTTTWLNSTFNHAAVFPLTGAHATTACAACHTNNNFTTLPKDCYGCHKADYNGAKDPNHAQAAFPTDCQVCHSTTNWLNAKFDHNKTTFPLTGAHVAVPCATCHTNNNFKTLPTDCYGCHTKDYNGTTNPDHAKSGIPTACVVCHNTTSWSNAKFDHNKTAFPLTGGHVTVPCATCHVNNNYTTLPTDCYSCHQKDFTGTTNPNHVKSGFPTGCAVCHNTTTWLNSTFNHASVFPLTGAHATTACAACHTNNNYKTLPTDCYGCHQKDFTGTTNPNHVQAAFPTDCQVCHSTTNWLSAKFDHNKTAFPLTGGHVTVPCASCHTNNNFTTLPTDCYGCHQKDFTGTTNPNHVKSGFPTGCAVCHNTTTWLNSTFNHASVFPLTGAHATTACAACHTNNNYKTLPTDCYGCHQKDFTGTTNPNHVQAAFPTDCQVCHSTTNWLNAKFDHNKTAFPLTGGHVTVPCATCHVNNNYKTLPTDCYGCHQKDFTGTTNPNHVKSGFPTGCAVCHNTTSWANAVFDHNKTTFPLTGSHVTVPCTSCHTNNNYTGSLPTDCYGCHQKDFTGTTNPNHVQSGFPTTCVACHNTTSWLNATFNHNTTTFPLTGAHVSVPCASCHTNNNYTGSLPTDCYGCHTKDYNGTTNPNHAQSGIPTTCVVCHSTTSWANAVFDHNKTAFPLTGAHVTVACATCHTNNNFKTLPIDCYGCHTKDYNGTTNPNHAKSGIPTTCVVCHSTTSWANAVFDHNKTTFPLTGSHVSVPCASCHTNNNYSGSLPTDCYGCHRKDFTGTTNPNHVQSGFPTTCVTCHNTTSWLNSTFNHNTTTFPLTGAHVSVPCASCHTNNNYTGSLPTDCYGCHQKDFTGTTNPNHVQAGFPTTCISCHSTTSWANAKFDHNKTTFPLTGSHVTVPCASCHTNNNYTGSLPTDCYGCHQKDFTGTTNPNHVQSGFPTTCVTCHNTTSWTNATFDHNKTTFPLTGAHTTVACASCHTNNNYSGSLPTDCYGCHQKDFTGTTNPNHVQAGFPTACISCHSTTTWLNAKFDHNKTTFPLTGSHVTVPCASCHTNNNYSGSLPTDCYGCHQKDFTGTTNPNHVQSGFPTTCVSCHSTTSWLNATFNHNTTTFPLTGAHVTVPCASCHTNNNYSGSLPTACYGCHQTDFTGTTNPAHVAAGFPTDCSICHSTSNWTTSTFNHSTTPFPLTGFHATMQCAQCHTDSTKYVAGSLPTDCYGCHQKDFTGTTNPNHVQSGFPTTCVSCHSTTNWLNATFNHNTTTFPLTGAHVSVPCASCHTNNNYTGSLPTACYGCHQADFTGATSPQPHAGFPTDCTLCHSTTSWTAATFNHSTFFPLVGFHATVPCASCHTNNNYTTVPTTCIGCHQTDFNGTTNPNHKTAGFPTTCDTCHTNTAWTPVTTFNHTLYANYALTGAHATLQCAQCHTNNNFNNLATACYSCHQADFTGTNNPAHVTAGFPTDCTICHSTSNWTTSTFNHSTTPFPLTGFHATMQCVQCHTDSTKYVAGSLPTACYGCHTADYNGTTNPNHASAGFPTTCDTCHTTTNWAGATFNHNNTPFPLTGFHVNVACNLCHINNVFVGTPTDCYSCHTKDYTGTTNPNHSTAGWPTTCATCHTTTAWLPATLPTSYHTFFPLGHGNANGVCTTCHTNSSDYSVFTCTGCHGGNNAANFKHPNVTGYSYLSSACLQCHKSGGGG